MGEQVGVRLRVNGEELQLSIEAGTLLIDLLREQLGLTGTKESCGVGVCGACTVLLDDAPVSSCLLPAVLCDGREVWTVEGLARKLAETGTAAGPGGLIPLQAAFVAHEGLQCGACTSGQVTAAFALLQANPHPTQAEISDWMSGNLCRCTGYQSILRAIRAAAGEEVDSQDARL